jgi:hypothetical protein
MKQSQSVSIMRKGLIYIFLFALVPAAAAEPLTPGQGPVAVDQATASGSSSSSPRVSCPKAICRTRPRWPHNEPGSRTSS